MMPSTELEPSLCLTIICTKQDHRWKLPSILLLGRNVSDSLVICYLTCSCYYNQFVSYHIISYIKSYQSYDIASYHIMSDHITSYHITSHHITSHHITSYHITSYHIISYHMIRYHMISKHILPITIYVNLHISSYILLCYYFCRFLDNVRFHSSSSYWKRSSNFEKQRNKLQDN